MSSLSSHMEQSCTADRHVNESSNFEVAVASVRQLWRQIHTLGNSALHAAHHCA